MGMKRGTDSAPMGLTTHIFDALKFFSAPDTVEQLAPEGVLMIKWRGREYNIVITRRR